MRRLAAILLGVLIVPFFTSWGAAARAMDEQAVVAETVYTPSRHDTGIGLKAFDLAGPISMDYGGDIGLNLGNGLQISSVTVPEKFAVIFTCQHGQFIIGRKGIYDKFTGHQGAKVDVTYREVYKTTYKKKDGKRQVVERVLTDYDFLDATLK